MTSLVTAQDPNSQYVDHLSSFLREHDQFSEGLEKQFNVLGYVPIVSTISGLSRIFYGKLNIVFSTALLAYNFFQDLKSGSSDYRIKIHHFVCHIVHGQLNLIRGVFEMIPVIGNLGCIIYDSIYRFKYEQEELINPRLKY